MEFKKDYLSVLDKMELCESVVYMSFTDGKYNPIFKEVFLVVDICKEYFDIDIIKTDDDKLDYFSTYDKVIKNGTFSKFKELLPNEYSTIVRFLDELIEEMFRMSSVQYILSDKLKDIDFKTLAESMNKLK